MARALLLKKIIELCQKNHCIEDRDFPAIFLHSIPFGQMLLPKTHEQEAGYVSSQLEQAIHHMDRLAVDHIIIACNTLHTFLENKEHKKIIHLPNLVHSVLLNKLKNEQKALLLSTYTTQMHTIYNRHHIVKVDNKAQSILDEIIKKIIAGKHAKEESKRIVDIVQSYKHKYKELNYVILGEGVNCFLSDKKININFTLNF